MIDVPQRQLQDTNFEFGVRLNSRGCTQTIAAVLGRPTRCGDTALGLLIHMQLAFIVNM